MTLAFVLCELADVRSALRDADARRAAESSFSPDRWLSSFRRRLWGLDSCGVTRLGVPANMYSRCSTIVTSLSFNVVLFPAEPVDNIVRHVDSANCDQNTPRARRLSATGVYRRGTIRGVGAVWVYADVGAGRRTRQHESWQPLPHSCSTAARRASLYFLSAWYCSALSGYFSVDRLRRGGKWSCWRRRRVLHPWAARRGRGVNCAQAASGSEDHAGGMAHDRPRVEKARCYCQLDWSHASVDSR